MALEKVVIPFSMGLSLDTNSDDKQLQGSLLELENAYSIRTGELQKRNGYVQLGQDTFSGGTIDSGAGLTTFNTELILISNNNLYSFAPNLNKWVDKGLSVATQVEISAIESNSHSQYSGDQAITRGLSVSAWEDSRGGVYALVQDVDSGAIILQETLISETGSRPRCIGLGQYLFIYYYDSYDEELLITRIDVTNPVSFTPPATVSDDISTTSPFFDVIVLGSRMIYTHKTNINEIKVAFFLQTLVEGNTFNGSPDPLYISEDPTGCLTIYNGVSEVSGAATFHLAWFNDTTGVQHISYTQYFSIIEDQQQIDSSVDPLIRNITGITYVTDDGDENNELFYEAEGTTPTDNYVNFAPIVDGYAVASPTIFQRAAGLASKPYRASNHTSILASYKSSEGLQDTYFALGTDSSTTPIASIEAKILAQRAGDHTYNDSNVPSVSLNNDLYYIAVGQKTKIRVGETESYTPTGLSVCEIDYTSPQVEPSSQLGENLHLPGGYVKMYDGLAPVEHNFHLYPEEPTIDPVVDGYMSGTYQYVAVYEWQDAKNQIHQSTTSVPINYVTDGYGGAQLGLPTLRYTAKKAPERTAVVISVYRTEDLGSIFYKVTSDLNPVFNDTTVDILYFTDDMSDAELISRPQLYTTGNILDNAPAPACSVVINAQNRLFVAGLENKNDIAFSKPFIPGEGVAFAPEQVVTIDARGGGITALSELDQNVVIFKETAIFLLTGNGIDIAGNGTPFTIQGIATDIGCTDAASIVLIPAGILFKSGKGIWLFGRDFKVSYIGDKVERFNDLEITGARVVPDLNQVRFTTIEGTTLVYDYFFNIWSTFSNQASVAATSWQGQYLFLRSNGAVWQEDRTIFSDNGSPIKTKIGTAWFSFSGIQGFQRIQRGQILGTYVGNHSLKLTVYYDFNEGSSQTFVKDLDSEGFNETYGEDSPYGSGTYGGEQGNYQWQFKLKKQKCQSMRLVIEDFFPDSEGTAGFKLSVISFLMALKKGMQRLPRSQSMRTLTR